METDELHETDMAILLATRKTLVRYGASSELQWCNCQASLLYCTSGV